MPTLSHADRVHRIEVLFWLAVTIVVLNVSVLLLLQLLAVIVPPLRPASGPSPDPPPALAQLTSPRPLERLAPPPVSGVPASVDP